MEPLGNPKTARRQEGGGQAGSGAGGFKVYEDQSGTAN